MEQTRQSKGNSLQQSLTNLTEDSTRILGAAVSLERRLVGNLMTPISEVKAQSAQRDGNRIGEPPLLVSVEEQIRKILGQIREASEILLSIERELS